MRHRLKAEAPAGWYDSVYADSEVYASSYEDSPYLGVWQEIARRIQHPTSVLEVGCGSGQLAQLLDDQKLLTDYVGFDFSEVAVTAARDRLTKHRFEVADALTTDLFRTTQYELVICTEVLEHIKRDRAVIKRIPSGKRLIATVPDFASETHVRWFPDERAVADRYERLLSDLVVESVSEAGWTIFVLDGTVT